MSDAYAMAGVDTGAADRAIGALVGVLRTIDTGRAARSVPLPGHYAAVLEVAPNLGIAIGTDGVGSKLIVAELTGRYDSVGIDCVAMNVNDVVCVGAEPIALVDYLAVERTDPGVFEAIARGLKRGAELAGVEIPGGEVAVLPELIRGHPSPNGFDLTAACFGTVALDGLVTGAACEPGDALIGLPSSGLHSNGYSLVRHVLLGAGRMRLDSVVDDFGSQRTLGEELLTPTKIYAKDCLGLIEETDVRAFSHVTGGGIPGNLVRILPEHVDAVVDRSTWRPQPIFDLIQAKGRIEDVEMEATFNMGVGMFAIVSSDDADRAMAYLTGRGIEAWQVGEIIEGTGQVQMMGQYTRG
jgi:phosphoribosylformylglycinamidine cyclo-ligase